MSSTGSMSALATMSNIIAMLDTWKNAPADQIGQEVSKAQAQSGSWSTGILSITHSARSGLTTTLVNTDMASGGTDSDAGYRGAIEQSIADKNAVTTANDQFSSQQISDALYSGAGLAAPATSGNSTSQFADTVDMIRVADASEQRFADMLSAWQASGMQENDYNFASTLGTNSKQVTAQIDSMRADVAQGEKLADALAQAFASHALTFQKATDVAGLDYSRTDVDGAYGNAEVGTTIENYNQSFTDLSGATVGADGKHHTLDSSSVYGVTLYLSW